MKYALFTFLHDKKIRDEVYPDKKISDEMYSVNV